MLRRQSGLFLALTLTACSLGTVRDNSASQPSTAVPTSTAPDPAAPTRVWLHPGLPPVLAAAAAPLFDEPAFSPAADPEDAALHLTFSPGEDAALKATWVYAVVAPFPTVPDDAGWEALGRYWQGDLNALPDFGAPVLVLSPDSVEVLTAIYGQPDSNVALTVVPAGQVLDSAWSQQPTLSLVPFEALEPRWKVLSVGGLSPLNASLPVADYPFTVEIGLSGDPAAAAQATALIQATGLWQPTNFDPARMTSVTMTGVTALSRAVAWQMELTGIEAQGADIKPLLAAADILHLSNEVSFAIDCPPPDPNGEPTFCSHDRYVALVRDLGPEVIELTGNHNNDWGTGAFVRTLEIYAEDGISYFGGGRDLDEARQTIYVERAGTRVAFLGCNLPGPNKAWATPASAGAAPCDDYADFYARLAEARQQADVVIATQQYWEFDHADPTPQQVADFAAIIDAGADIVSGSQAHQPQTLAFHEGRFVHYGLGNLFFDPLLDVEKDFFIDTHVLYEGRHISTVLLTGRIENYGRPRPMTPEERAAFLAEMFAASGW